MLTQIIWFLTWPLLIYISYWAVKFLVNKTESNLDEE